MRISTSYTLDDHKVRTGDRYAQAKYEITRRWIASEAQPGMTLVNVGCGSGYFNQIAHIMGFHVIAAEPDPSAFELALKWRPDSPSVEVYNYDLQELAKRKVTGDVVVFHDVLEHIENDREASMLLRSIVKSDGRVIVSVPALQWLFGRHDEELGHYRRYTRSSLTRVLEPSFNILRMRYFGALSIPIVLAFSKLLRTSYPGSATGDSPLAGAYGLVCDLETHLTFPIGTSLIAEIAPK